MGSSPEKQKTKSNSKDLPGSGQNSKDKEPTKSNSEGLPDSTVGSNNELVNRDQKSTTTVFVSNLPLSLTSEGLLERASSIGPVRAAFVVTDSNTKSSRGFGYVKFVLRDDAEAALKDGFGKFDGHSKTVLVTWAKPKLHPDEKTKKQEEKKASKNLKRSNDTVDEQEPDQESPPEQKRQKNNSTYQTKKDVTANRVVVVQGLPIPPKSQNLKLEPGKDSEAHQSDGEGLSESKELQSDSAMDPGISDSSKEITTKALYKKAKKLLRFENIEFPVLGNPGASTACAHFIFSDPTAAAVGQTRLHGHIFKGHFITAVIKSRLDALTRLGHAFGGRVIVRNLESGITEQDLRYLFAPFGPIHSIDIPTTVKGQGSKPRCKGFAFVWMISEADAARAIKGLNGKKVYAGVSAEAIKNETDGQKKSIKRKQSKAEEKPENRGRAITVDLALSKKVFEEAEKQKKTKNKAADDEEDTSEGESASDDDDDDDDDDGSFDDSEGFDTETDEFSGDEDSETDNDRSGTSENPGNTLFIRNLSFEATEEELHALFRPFGPLRYARIVMDPKLGRSRGTGFVCLWNKADAEKVLEISRKLESEGFGHGPPAANGMPSLLQPDPSSSLAAQLTLHGRVLGVSEAVSREKAEKFRVERDKSGKGKDKRNLYLMREGVIFPNSNESRGLHPADLETRQQSFDQRKALLRSNPSLFISHTRLSVRQLPLFVSERSLKRLARHALSQWRKEVKAGKRVELTEEELSVGSRENQKTPKVDSQKKGPNSKVKQVKVLRTIDKLDGLTGLGKSKGYGFLDMDNHADALRVLRWANANPLVDGLLKEWTSEELEAIIKKHEQEPTKIKPSKDSKKAGDQSNLDEHRIEKLRAKIKELRSELEKSKKKNDRLKVKVESKEQLESDGSKGKPHRMLIIEFAIENAQVVKKRLERREKSRNAPNRATKESSGMKENAEDNSKRNLGKKRKRQDQANPDSEEPDKSSLAKGDGSRSLGRLIGKKRKLRKNKGK